MMLTDQLTAQVRMLLTAIGTILGMLGVVNPEIVGNYVNTAMLVLGALMVIASSAWSIYSNLKSSIIASANAIPEVKGVITTNTTAGRTLADSIPGPTVATAGTSDAAKIAKANGAN